jgi:hypothetical protein
MNPTRKLWVKTFTKRWSKRLLLTTLWVGGLGTLFYGIENWRAKRALAEHYEWLKSKGESLDPAQFDPPPVPDEDNAAFIPVFECFYTKDATGNRVWAINSIGDVPDGLPEEQKEKLREWARFKNSIQIVGNLKQTENGALDYEKYLKYAKLSVDKLRESNPKIRLAPLPQGTASAEEKLRMYLQQFTPMFQDLREASQRTQCRWPRPQADLNFPRAGLSMSLFKALHLDATFAIYRQDSVSAFLDLEAMAVLALDDATGTEALISGLVTSAQWKLYVKCLETLLASHASSEAQWERIARKSPIPQIQNFFKDCLRGERVFREQYRNSAEYGLSLATAEFPKGQKILGAALLLGPSGWSDRNHIAMSNETQAWIDLLDGEEPPLLAKAISRTPAPHNSIYNFMADSGDIRPWADLAESAERLQLAPVAIALKRHQIKNGAFPDDLTQVIPEFLPKLPQSYFDAMAPKYRRLPEGSFKIWFNGLDGDDDDGRQQDQTKGSDSKHDYDIVFAPGPPIP